MAERLRRGLSLPGAVAAIVGLIVGASIFVLLPSLAGMTGPSLYLAYGLSVIPAIFSVLYLVQLGGAFPVTGGHYIALTRLISPLAGWAVSMAGLLAIISTNCIVAWGFAEYLGTYAPGVPLLATAMGIVLLLAIINYVGIRFVGWSQLLMMGLFIVGMLIFGIGGVANVKPEYLTPLFPEGIGGFFMVIVIASFSWAGFAAFLEVGGEIKNPRRNIPLALIISLLIILVLYLLQPFALTGTMLWSEAAEIGPTAILVAASRFLPEGAVTFIAVAAMLAMVTTINSMLLTLARDACAWGRDGVIPGIFGRVSRRFGTPEIGLLMVTVLSLIGILFAARLDQYALLVVLALMIIKIVASTATWLMPRRAPDLYSKSLFQFRPFWRWFTWIGCLVIFSVIFLFGIMADLPTALVLLGVVVVGVAYWFARKAYLKRRGVDLDQKLKTITGAALEELEEKE